MQALHQLNRVPASPAPSTVRKVSVQTQRFVAGLITVLLLLLAVLVGATLAPRTSGSHSSSSHTQPVLLLDPALSTSSR